MAQRILIVEDEDILREIIGDYLMADGFQIADAADGEKALELFQTEEIDLVILDIMLPKIDGWSVCRRIRKQSNVPIIILTARSDEDDSLLGYELGADDYLIKPFNPRILAAKVRRFLKRSAAAAYGTISSGGIVLDLGSRSVELEDRTISLTHTEFETLAYLMQNEGLVLSREQLISRIWGYDFVGDEKTINSHIRNLRAKLGAKGRFIVTVIRSGYKFVKE